MLLMLGIATLSVKFYDLTGLHWFIALDADLVFCISSRIVRFAFSTDWINPCLLASKKFKCMFWICLSEETVLKKSSGL